MLQAKKIMSLHDSKFVLVKVELKAFAIFFVKNNLQMEVLDKVILYSWSEK